jgi:hypothetical protein
VWKYLSDATNINSRYIACLGYTAMFMEGQEDEANGGVPSFGRLEPLLKLDNLLVMIVQ